VPFNRQRRSASSSGKPQASRPASSDSRAAPTPARPYSSGPYSAATRSPNPASSARPATAKPTSSRPAAPASATPSASRPYSTTKPAATASAHPHPSPSGAPPSTSGAVKRTRTSGKPGSARPGGTQPGSARPALSKTRSTKPPRTAAERKRRRELGVVGMALLTVVVLLTGTGVALGYGVGRGAHFVRSVWPEGPRVLESHKIAPPDPDIVDGPAAACHATSLTVSVTPDSLSIREGQSLPLAVRVEHTGRRPCVLEAGAENRVIEIRDATGAVVWTSRDCPGEQTRELLLGPGDFYSRTVKWPGRTSAPHVCSEGLAAVPPGQYSVVAFTPNIPGAVSDAVQISVTPKPQPVPTVPAGPAGSDADSATPAVEPGTPAVEPAPQGAPSSAVEPAPQGAPVETPAVEAPAAPTPTPAPSYTGDGPDPEVNFENAQP
jgi:hypothetical protein